MDLIDVKAKVYEPTTSFKRRKTIVARLSTYEGKNEDGTKKYSSWNTYFVGAAYEKARELKTGDWIIIKQGKVENQFSKKKKQLYINVTIFDFDIDIL